MSLEALKIKLKSNVPGIYLFWGDEEYLKDHYISQLRGTVKASPLPEFNHIIFEFSGLTPESLSEAVFSLPFMWDKKLIEIKNCDFSTLKQDVSDLYKEVLSDLPDYAAVLFVCKSGFPPSKDETGLRELIKTNGCEAEFDCGDAEKLKSWILKHMAANGLKAGYDTAEALLELCGNEMYTLANEIKKLSFCGEKDITPARVSEYCCANESRRFYQLSDAVLRSDVSAVSSVYGILVKEKRESDSIKTTQMLLGQLAKFFMELNFIKTAVKNGADNREISAALKKQEWQIKKTVQGLKNKRPDYADYASKTIFETDIMIKSSRVEPSLALELAIYRICLYGKNSA